MSIDLLPRSRRPRPAVPIQAHPGGALPRGGWILASALLGALLSLLAPPPRIAAQEGTVIFLVRHAERAEDGTEDPHISAQGRERARLLARILADAGLTHVHATDYQRTRETAGPLLEGTGLPLDVYDATDLDAFAARLKRTPGRHLVVGHSNTTPELVSALGGEPGASIESQEYDRLYVLFLGAERVETLLLRFGSPVL